MKGFLILCAVIVALEAAPTFVVTGVTTASASTGLALLGLAKLGTAFALALGQSARRGKRETSEDNEIKSIDETIWKAVAKDEEDACLRRFVCEVATGTLVAPEYVNMIKNLLAVDTTDEHDEAKTQYVKAAQSGATHLNVAKCQEVYECKSSGAELYNIFRGLEF